MNISSQTYTLKMEPTTAPKRRNNPQDMDIYKKQINNYRSTNNFKTIT